MVAQIGRSVKHPAGTGIGAQPRGAGQRPRLRGAAELPMPLSVAQGQPAVKQSAGGGCSESWKRAWCARVRSVWHGAARSSSHPS